MSLALLPIFTQNLIFIRCSRFLSHIFPPTVYHGHLLLSLLLGNELLILSVAHVNSSWYMSNRAWVHDLPDSTPSDTLRPFRELSCRTLCAPPPSYVVLSSRPCIHSQTYFSGNMICNSIGCIDIRTGAVRQVQLVDKCLKMAL
jgi:hypothetical protein